MCVCAVSWKSYSFVNWKNRRSLCSVTKNSFPESGVFQGDDVFGCGADVFIKAGEKKEAIVGA